MSASPEELWSAVVQAALVGTERAPRALAGALPAAGAPPDLAEALTLATARRAAGGGGNGGNGGNGGEDLEGSLLDAAAALSLYVRAGRLPAAGLTPAPATGAAPADADDLPEVPPAAVRSLARMYSNGTAELLLPEWLRLAAARGLRIPPLALPAALDAGRRSPELRALIPPVLGGRGRWLAAQNPEWGYAVGATEADDAGVARRWETGTLQERSALLARLRQSDPARARELLAATWAQEPPKERAAFIETLAEGLSDADEPFLEAALDDKRKDVRRPAAELLARLPGSRLVARMRARLEPLLSYERPKLLRGARLLAEPPAACDKAAERDGVVAKPPNGTSMGERAWWLRQMLAAVPPSHWSAAWGIAPEVLVKHAHKSDWSAPLIDGWTVAAWRHRDAAWIEALLADPDRPRAVADISDTVVFGQHLAEALPPEQRERVVMRGLARDDDRGYETTFYCLTGCTHAWSERFAAAVLDMTRRFIVLSMQERNPQRNSLAYYLREQLPGFAAHIPVSLAERAASGWPAGETEWTRSIDSLVELLQVRREMVDAFR